MRNNAPTNSAASTNQRGYSDEEYNAALCIMKFLHDLWREQLRNEIIKSDKTIYDNEGPANAN